MGEGIVKGGAEEVIVAQLITARIYEQFIEVLAKRTLYIILLAYRVNVAVGTQLQPVSWVKSLYICTALVKIAPY